MKFHTLKYLVLFLFLASSCSTEKNTFMSRSFHNMTSHYNIYFNGYESYKKGIKRTEESYQDNFTRLLPLFYFSDESVAQSIAPDMQRALEKATKVITLHSITAKPEVKKGPQSQKQKDFYNQKEYNRWIDDNYVLMGKAYVYKNEFFLALETFKKVIADFPGEESMYEALVWMARAYNEMEEYREAEKILNNLKNDENFPNSLMKDLNTSYADFYMKQSQNEKAIPYLEKALTYPLKKHYKIRYTYILAQLNQFEGNPGQTIKNYRKVIKMNPPYEMTFNAKINMASSFEVGSGQGKEFHELLEKMLKDDKNNDFQDQIYYALGNIALKEGKEARAIEYFQLSARKSLTNLNQKGLSYLAIADIYYAKPEYSLAQAYYDSSMQNINQDYDYYEDLSAKARSLNHLVRHLDVFVLEDSLQRLAAMSEESRFAVIDQIIEEVTQKEREEKLREQRELENLQYGISGSSSSGTGSSSATGGSWYFYNLNAKGFGQPEFRMKWGSRKLEDNWRRKDKQSIEIFDPEVEEERIDSTTEEEAQLLNNKSREYYLKNIPFTDSALEISHTKLENALYNMALVYMNELNDEEEAVSSYKEVLKRYPKGEMGLLTAYELYEYYQNKGNTQQAEYYKNYVISNFPDSPRARILSDPNYVESLLKDKNKANVLYDETYQEYVSGNYQKVIADSEYASRQFRGDKTIPKFKMLRALSIGRLEGNDRLTDELRILIEEFPNEEVSKYAAEIIKHVYDEAPEIAEADVVDEAEEIYNYNEERRYYFGVSTKSKGEYNQIKFNLINFNLDHFDRLNLALEEEEIGTDNVLFVKSFENYENAKRYFDAYGNFPDEVYRDVNTEELIVFLISDINYKILKRDTQLQKYYLYFRKYYQP